MNMPVDAGVVAAEVRGLPPLPQVATKLIEMMRAPDASAAEMARLIATDSALTASLLRLVNSPFFGLQRQIASVKEALHVLGLNAVQRLVVSAAVVRPLFAVFSKRAQAQVYWRQRLRCALIARELARGTCEDTAFVAGLLHDVGELGMLVRFGGSYATFLDTAAPQGPARIQAERVHFGVDHAQLGAAILHRWSLPAEIAEAVGRHHEAGAASGPPLVAAVWAASQIGAALEGGAEATTATDPLGRLNDEAFARVGRELESMEALLN